MRVFVQFQMSLYPPGSIRDGGCVRFGCCICPESIWGTARRCGPGTVGKTYSRRWWIWACWSVWRGLWAKTLDRKFSGRWRATPGWLARLVWSSPSFRRIAFHHRLLRNIPPVHRTVSGTSLDRTNGSSNIKLKATLNVLYIT